MDFATVEKRKVAAENAIILKENEKLLPAQFTKEFFESITPDTAVSGACITYYLIYIFNY